MPSEDISHEVTAEEREGEQNWIRPMKGAKDHGEEQGGQPAVSDQEDQTVVEERLYAELLQQTPSEITSQAKKGGGVESREKQSSEQRTGNDLSAKEQQGRQDSCPDGRPEHVVSYAQGC